MIGQTQSRGKPSFGQIVTAVMLWSIMSIVGIWLIPQLMDSSTVIFASFSGSGNQFAGRDYYRATLLRSVVAIIFGILLLGVMVGSAEYYFNNLGKPGSWTLLIRIIAVEISLIVLTLLL
jgi:hypothetical protein